MQISVVMTEIPFVIAERDCIIARADESLDCKTAIRERAKGKTLNVITGIDGNYGISFKCTLGFEIGKEFRKADRRGGFQKGTVNVICVNDSENVSGKGMKGAAVYYQVAAG
jgi:hypothetical protein